MLHLLLRLERCLWHVRHLVHERGTVGGSSSHQSILLRGGDLLLLCRLLGGFLLQLRTGPHGDSADPWVVEGRPRRAALVPTLAAVLVLAIAAGGAALGTSGGGLGRGRCRGGAALGSSGDEHRRGCWGQVGLVGSELLKEQIVAHVVEGRERSGLLEQGHHVAVLLVEAAQDIQNQGAVLDDLTQVPKIICHLLHALTVIGDREIALLEEAKLGVELKRASFTVAAELLIDAQPGDPRGVIPNADRLHQIGVEGAEKPRADHGVHASPSRGGRGGVEEDMIIEGIAFQSEEHQISPPVVVGGEGFQDNRHECSDVLDGGCLGVKVGDGGSLKDGIGIAVDVVVHRWWRLRAASSRSAAAAAAMRSRRGI